MNKLIAAYKPSGIGSNKFLYSLKKKYKEKKAGFAGTLDPFAKGVLLVGFGSYTKLFRFLNKTPKTYRATLWLGAKSITLDNEMIENIELLDELSYIDIENALKSLEGELEYEPPIFSAKRINGMRAYDLARAGETVELNKINSTVYKTKLINYSHPFVTFEATVSEGTYIRSIGLLLANKLGVKDASLSMLERINEGQFFYENEKDIDIKKALNIPQNYYLGDEDNVKFGRILDIKDLKIQDDGTYFLDNGDNISVIKIEAQKVDYELGRIYVC